VKDMNEVEEFVQECQKLQPHLTIGWKYLFRGIITVPHNQESLLQAYLVDNLELLYGIKAQLILYESALPGEMSDKGMVDLIFLTDENNILIVETKYVTSEKGPTARTQRRKHRNHVVKQVLRTHEKLRDVWQISPDKLSKMVFTNDTNIEFRIADTDVLSCSLTDQELNSWRNEKIAMLIECESLAQSIPDRL